MCHLLVSQLDTEYCCVCSLEHLGICRKQLLQKSVFAPIRVVGTPLNLSQLEIVMLHKLFSCTCCKGLVS